MKYLCGCKVKNFRAGSGITYCPLHDHAAELLAALVELVAVPNKHRPEWVWEDARVAISKAEGKV